MNYMLKDENAIYYECQYSCDNALYLVLGDEAFFITDSRYTSDAQENVMGANIVIGKNLYQEAVTLLQKYKIKKIVFDPKEWSVFGFELIRSKTKTTLIPHNDFSHKKRMVKKEYELNLLKKSAQLGKKAFKKLSCLFHAGGVGKDEFKLTQMARNALSDDGKYDLSFEPIVAINENASKPHAFPTKKRLKEQDLLLVDAGLKYKRYCSDRTRTVNLSLDFKFKTTQKFHNKKRQKAYDTVLKAHDKAIEKARVGMRAKEIDAITREIIDKAGFGKFYIHSTGHGVGLDIHEMPYIASSSQTVIENAMVYTVEPGIYIPSEFGIRIEDMVVMRDGKAEIL